MTRYLLTLFGTLLMTLHSIAVIYELHELYVSRSAFVRYNCKIGFRPKNSDDNIYPEADLEG